MQVRVDMGNGGRVEADTKSARWRSSKRSSVVASPEEAGSGGGHVKCAANCLLRAAPAALPRAPSQHRQAWAYVPDFAYPSFCSSTSQHLQYRDAAHYLACV
jgi:hypothetical protein